MKKAKNLLGSIIQIGGVDKVCNVVAIITNEVTKKEKIIPGANIVTNEGDKYYAQMAAGETPTIDFTAGGFRLGDSGTTPQKSDTDVGSPLAANHTIDTGYPTTDDQDGDNTDAGVDIVTWRAFYSTSEGNVVGIQEVAIVDNISTPTAALCHAVFSGAFSKTVNDTLKIFINHEFNGVSV